MSTKRAEKKKKYIIIAIAIIVLGIILAVIGGMIINKTNNVVSLWTNKEKISNISYYDKLQIWKCMEKYSFIMIDENASIKNDFHSLFNVSVNFVQSEYIDIYDIELVKGRWLFEEDASLGRAVVEKDTALLLFGSYDCIGEKFEYRDNEYFVIGICENMETYKSIAENSIYLMYDMYDMYYEDQAADYYGTVGTPRNSAQFSHMVLSQIAEKSLKNYTIYDGPMLKQKALYTLKLLILPILIIILIYIFKIIKKWTIAKIKHYKNILELQYLTDVLRKIILHSLLLLLMIAFWIVLIGLCYKFMINNLFYFEEYIPVTLFDNELIMNSFRKIIFETNAAQFYKPSDILSIYWGEKIITASFFFFYAGGLLIIKDIVRIFFKKNR